MRLSSFGGRRQAVVGLRTCVALQPGRRSRPGVCGRKYRRLFRSLAIRPPTGAGSGDGSRKRTGPPRFSARAASDALAARKNATASAGCIWVSSSSRAAQQKNRRRELHGMRRSRVVIRTLPAYAGQVAMPRKKSSAIGLTQSVGPRHPRPHFARHPFPSRPFGFAQASFGRGKGLADRRGHPLIRAFMLL